MPAARSAATSRTIVRLPPALAAPASALTVVTPAVAGLVGPGVGAAGGGDLDQHLVAADAAPVGGGWRAGGDDQAAGQKAAARIEFSCPARPQGNITARAPMPLCLATS